MTITATCAACGATFRVSDEHAGKRTKCKSCGAVMTIPMAEEADEAEPEAPAPTRTPRRAREGAERPRRRRTREPEPDALPPAAIAGAVVAGLAGAAIWAFIGIQTGRSFGYGAAGLGMLVGFAAAKLGGRGKVAGAVAAVIAAAGIVGGTYAIYASLHDEIIEEAMKDPGLRSDLNEEFQFERDLGEWSKSLEDPATPSDLREFLDIDTEEDGGPPDADLRAILDELPAMESYVGDGGYDRFKAQARDAIGAEFNTMSIMEEGIGPIDILFLVIGVGAAFSFVAGASRS